MRTFAGFLQVHSQGFGCAYGFLLYCNIRLGLRCLMHALMNLSHRKNSSEKGLLILYFL